MTNHQKKYNLISLILAFAVILIQGYLSLHYFELKFGLGNGTSICNVSSFFNCDKATLSQFSSLFGIPIAAFGLSLHIILFILLGKHRFSVSSNKDLAGKWSFIIAIISVLASVVMAAFSLAFVGSLCLFCLACYILSVILVFTIYKSNSTRVSILNEIADLFKNEGKKWPLIYLALIPGLAVFGNFIYTKNLGIDKLNQSITEFSTNWDSAPTMNFTKMGVLHGSTHAKMVIVEFADFLCPHCRVASGSFKSFLDNHPDVQIIFKPYPLDGNCNTSIEHKGDNNRCILAKSSLCSEELYQNGWLIAKDIFDKQEDIYQLGDVSQELSKIYTKFKMDESKMKECIASEKIHNLLIQLTEEGKAAKIQGTPAIFVNNKELEGGQFIPVLQNIYDKINH